MINCSVIGLGNMGKHHARIYRELECCNLVAVSDLDFFRGKAIADKYGCRFYYDFREMIRKEPIEAVSICVPSSAHEEVSCFCIGKGVHVLLEKPIAPDIKAATRITEAAHDHGAILQVGHIEHFNPAVIKLKEVLGRNALGKLLTIVAKRVGTTPPQIQDSNVIIDLAIHDIDLCNHLLKQLPEKTYCRAGAGILDDREDYADIFLEYNGVNVFIQSNWITPVKIRQMHITGTKGYAELDFIKQKLSLTETIADHEYDDYGSFVVKFRQSKRQDIPVVRNEPLKLEIEYFLECIAIKAYPFIDGKWATDALRVALEAWSKSTGIGPANRDMWLSYAQQINKPGQSGGHKSMTSV